MFAECVWRYAFRCPVGNALGLLRIRRRGYLFLQGALLQRIKNAVDVRGFRIALRGRYNRRIRFHVDRYFEAFQSTQDETDFSSRFPLLHFDKPLPARPGLLSQGSLIHPELGSALPDEGPQIGSGSDTHPAHLHSCSLKE